MASYGGPGKNGPFACKASTRWEQFRATQQRLLANQFNYREARCGAPRVGVVLLQGIARCGRCGARLWVRYGGARGKCPGYVCNTTG